MRGMNEPSSWKDELVLCRHLSHEPLHSFSELNFIIDPCAIYNTVLVKRSFTEHAVNRIAWYVTQYTTSFPGKVRNNWNWIWTSNVP